MSRLSMMRSALEREGLGVLEHISDRAPVREAAGLCSLGRSGVFLTLAVKSQGGRGCSL